MNSYAFLGFFIPGINRLSVKDYVLVEPFAFLTKLKDLAGSASALAVLYGLKKYPASFIFSTYD